MLNTISPLFHPATGGGRILLTCWRNAGSLALVQSFAEELNCQAVILSPDQAVSQAAVSVGITAVTGEDLTAVEATHGQFSLVLVPGPLITHHRVDQSFLEWRHVQEAGPYLRVQGVIALIVHRAKISQNPRILASLLQAYRDLRLFRFDQDNLLIAGVRRGTRSKNELESFEAILQAVREDQLPGIGTQPRFDLPDIQAGRRIFFRSRNFDPAAAGQTAAGLPWGEKRLRTALAGWSIPTLTPSMPLRAMHLGAAISSGVLGSLRVRSGANGDDYVIRGRTVRRVSRSFSNEEEAAWSSLPGAANVYAPEPDQKTGDFITDISLVNLTRAEIRRVDPQNPREMSSFLEEFGPALAETAAANYTPLYDPREDPYQEILDHDLVRVIDAPLNWTSARVSNISGTAVPSLSERQRHFTAAAFLKLLGRDAVRLERKKSYPGSSGRLIISGQTAVGKTIISHRLQLGLQLHHARRSGLKVGQPGWPLSMFVATPANIPHVLKELKTAAPLFDPRVIRTAAELRAALDEVPHNPKPIMLIISRTILRQMPKIIPAYRQSLRTYEDSRSEIPVPILTCPTCGAQIAMSRKDVQHWPDDDFLVNGGRIRFRGRKCSACKAALYQQTHHGAYNLAILLRRELKRRRISLLSLVIDEIHQDANLTNQGFAMGWLADLAKYVVGMSGTVYGGAPQSVFYLLFRLIPDFREQWDITEVDRFIKRYGNWQQKRLKNGRWGNRLALPGISPELIAGIFLNYATIITQSDIGLPMPERRDLPLELSPSAEEAEGLALAAASVKAALKTSAASASPSYASLGASAQLLYLAPVGMHLKELSPFSPAYHCSVCGKRKVATLDKCQHYWVREEDELEQMEPEQRRQIEPLIALQVLDPGWRATKEQALISLVRSEKQEGRPVLIYVHHTGKYEIDTRLEEVLAADGLSALNLGSTNIQRLEQVVNSAGFNGIDALIANPARVGTGLNLVGAPSAVWYQPIWAPKLMIQASARSDRPGQDKRVRVYYPVVKGSAETVVLSRVIEKIISIYLLAGIEYGTMSDVIEAAGHRESFTEAMIRFVSSHVEVDLSTMFDQLTQLDLDRTPQSQAAFYQANQERSSIEVVDLSGAYQPGLFE